MAWSTGIASWLNKPGRLKRLLLLLLVGPLVPALIVTPTFFAYAFWPQDYDAISQPHPAVDVRHIVLVAHGVHDDPASWADPLATAIGNEPGVQAIALDWSAYSQDLTRCAVDARRIGADIAERLAPSPTLASLHLIGHSCGSFLVLGVCETMQALRSDMAIHTTYLAPVSVYGGMLWDYGIDRFGRCGSFSEAYIDTEDRTPGASQPLPHAFTFDITALREPAGFAGAPHLWPVAYYSALRADGKAPDLREGQAVTERWPRGAQERVTP